VCIWLCCSSVALHFNAMQDYFCRFQAAKQTCLPNSSALHCCVVDAGLCHFTVFNVVSGCHSRRHQVSSSLPTRLLNGGSTRTFWTTARPSRPRQLQGGSSSTWFACCIWVHRHMGWMLQAAMPTNVWCLIDTAAASSQLLHASLTSMLAERGRTCC